MNKKIIAISVLMLMICAMAVAVFANDGKWEYKYNVEIIYDTGRTRTSGTMITETKIYPVWASSQGEAMELAKKACEWEGKKAISCGIPMPTGERREK